jgi:ABC-2 type transport system permease protein
MFQQIWALAVKEVKTIIRDRHALAILFLMPAIFIFFLSIALQDLYSGKNKIKMTVIVQDQDEGSFFSKDFVKYLIKRGDFNVREIPGDEVITQNQIVKDVVAITIPKGASQAFVRFVTEKNFPLTDFPKMTVVFDPALDAAYRLFFNGTLGGFFYESILIKVGDFLQNTPTGNNFPRVSERSTINIGDLLQEKTLVGDNKPPNPVQQNVPGWSVFAMFFIAVPLASGVIRERSNGTLKRVLTFPVSRQVLILGKILPFMAINFVQFYLMLGMGYFVLPLFSDMSFTAGNQWGNLAVLTLVVSLATTSFAVAVATISKSQEHATALVGGIVMTMAVLGGIMVPVFVMPAFMQVIAQFSPMYWAHQAYIDLMVRDLHFRDIMTYILQLIGFTAVCMAVGVGRFRWL